MTTQKVAWPMMIVRMPNGMPVLWNADSNAMPVTMPGRAMGSTSTSENGRSEEHTSELQSHVNLVCRLLLECSRAPLHLHSFPTRRSSDLGHPPQPGDHVVVDHDHAEGGVADDDRQDAERDAGALERRLQRDAGDDAGQGDGEHEHQREREIGRAHV